MASSPKSIDIILCDAVEIASSEQRARYLDQACGGDTVLRRRIEILMADHFQAGDFLEQPAVSIRATSDSPLRFEPQKTQIGPYKLLQPIGEGGMGVVYMAEQSHPVERRVALKIIKPGMDSRTVIARFEAERQALALMDHPNICKVLDAATTDSGHPYFVMELMKGVPITRYCDEQQLTTRERLKLFVPVCQAVQHAHQKGIIHRDIKPSNVLVALYDGEPVPKVIDFGLAKATGRKLTEKTMFTHYGQVVGTLEYMSPEQSQINQLDVDTRTDIYSLGVLLYELLTGVTPFDPQRLRSAAFDEILRNIREEEPPRPSIRLSSIDTLPSVAANRRSEPQKLRTLVRGELDWIVMKALEKDRARRYDSPHELVADIQRYLDDEPVEACPPSAGYRLRKFARRNKVLLTTAMVVAAALLLGLIGTTWQMLEAENAREVAEREKERVLELERETREQRDYAVAAERETREQLHISNVLRLAAQSEAVRDELPETSLLLALKAVEISRADGRPVIPVAHETLMAALPAVGGKLLEGKGYARISQDGQWLVVRKDDQALRLWDLTTASPGEKWVDLSAEGDGGFRISPPDGRWLMNRVRGESTLSLARVWDLHAEPDAIASTERTLHGHSDFIFNVTFSRTGRWMATVSADRTVRVWDLEAENAEVTCRVLAGHERGVGFADFSWDERWLASGSLDNTARLWDLSDVDPVASSQVLRGHEKGVFTYFSPDMRWLVTISGDNTARLWDYTSGELESPKFVLEHPGWVGRAAFTPDGQWLATICGDKTARLWNLNDPTRPARVLRGHKSILNYMDISRDGRWLATASADNTARLWDLTAQDPSATSLALGHQGTVMCVSIGPNNRWLATATWGSNTRLWDLEAVNPASLLILRGHESAIRGLAVSPDGRWLVSGSEDATARLWALDPQGNVSRCVILRGHDRGLNAVSVSPDSHWLATVSNDHTARIWDLLQDDPSRSPHVLRHEGPVETVVFSKDGRWLATAGEDTTARLWDLTDLNRPAFVFSGHQDLVQSVEISPNGHWLLTASRDGTARVWELSNQNQLTASLSFTQHGGRMRAVFGAKHRWVVTSNLDGVRLWDLSASDPSADSIALPAAGEMNNITPDGRWLLTSKGTEFAKLWDLDADDPSSSPITFRPAANIWASGISADGRWLAISLGVNLQVELWDLAALTSGNSTAPLSVRGHGDAIVESFAFTPDGRWLITGAQDNTVRLWDLDLDSLIRRARLAAGRELSPDEIENFKIEQTGSLDTEGER